MSLSALGKLKELLSEVNGEVENVLKVRRSPAPNSVTSINAENNELLFWLFCGAAQSAQEKKQVWRVSLGCILCVPTLC